ncbi:TIGR03564 family F420-dependent LLM class oxidoreductase [Nocardia fusca]|uniref:TIGR03564 family F420-dependent LLM class oxidoreductase n=1 Tax=Nocardia fusca TaxID=941183 RepID=UPI0037B134D9
MQVGLMISSSNVVPSDLDRMIAEAVEAEALGFDSVWMPLGFVQHGAPALFGHDPITTLAAVAGATEGIELGTAILPIQHRHPIITAQHALSLSALSNDRFTLGLGNSHRHLVAHVLGLNWDAPMTQMRDYLAVIDVALSGSVMSYQGDCYRVQDALMPGADDREIRRPSILLSAMGPAMLRLAGALTDGTITGFTGPRTLESHIVPTMRAAAAQADRKEPRIVASVQFALTDDVQATRERIAPLLAGYGGMPSYRAMLDREGVENPADLVVAGDAKTIGDALRRLQDIGVTDVLASTSNSATSRQTKEVLVDFTR